MIIKPNKLDQAVTSRISFLLGIEQLAYFRKNGTNFRLNSEQDNYVESTLLKFLCPKPYAIKDIKPKIIFKMRPIAYSLIDDLSKECKIVDKTLIAYLHSN